MTFISYAQNYEDVMLWRALRQIKNGFYVDVGASDPSKLSVTRAFYDNGWSGINIEPEFSYFEQLKNERPRDINLNLAAGSRNGNILFYEIPRTPLSTAQKHIAEMHMKNGLSIRKTLIPAQTLNKILEDNAHNKTIHFMNIDVEGSEADVLQGLNLSRWRPWILLVESTKPTTRKANFNKWEYLLKENQYKFVYFDALNRFYIAQEHIALEHYFNLPPNLFDDIVLASQLEDQHRVSLLSIKLSQSHRQIDKLANNLSLAYKANEQIVTTLIDNIKSLQLRLEQSKGFAKKQNEELIAKEEVIQSFRGLAKKQNEELIAKEEVIQSFRESFSYIFMHGPFRSTPLFKKAYHFLKKWKAHIKGLMRYYFSPRLGQLYQFQPRPNNIPDSYFRVKHSSKPKATISIVTPTLNQAVFLERSIKSVIHQSYPNLEYIIQDGGSTDNTVDIIKKFKHHLKHFDSNKDNGQAHAINLGFQHSAGEIMAYLNSDDVLLPETLDYVNNYFSNHPEIDVIYGHRLIIDNDDMVIGEWIMPPHNNKALRWVDYIPQETIFWRKRIWEKIGGRLDESFQFAMDWDLLLRFQDVGAVFKRLPRFLSAFRIHPQQKTSLHISSLGAREVEVLRQRIFSRQVTHKEIERNTRSFLMQSIWHHWLHKLQIKKHIFLAKLQKEEELRNWYEPESIYFYSLHKAGTSLFTHVLRQAAELIHVDYETMLFDNIFPDKTTFKKYGHLYGVLRIVKNKNSNSYNKLIKAVLKKEFVANKNIIFLIRDPRDIIISLYFSLGFSHVSSPNSQIEKELQVTRKHILALDVDEYAIFISPIISQRFMVIEELSKFCKHCTILKYEDLIENFDDFIQNFSKHISISERTKQELYDISRPNNNENPTAHKRSGKTGQYKDKLKVETIYEVNRILRDVLIRYGYGDE
jgi:FkbM family methyltransferase